MEGERKYVLCCNFLFFLFLVKGYMSYAGSCAESCSRMMEAISVSRETVKEASLSG